MQENTITTNHANTTLAPVRFSLGRMFITQGASNDDHQENLFSVDKYLRIFSAFKTAKDVKLWVITEADRSATTILLPSEY